MSIESNEFKLLKGTTVETHFTDDIMTYFYMMVITNNNKIGRPAGMHFLHICIFLSLTKYAVFNWQLKVKWLNCSVLFDIVKLHSYINIILFFTVSLHSWSAHKTVHRNKERSASSHICWLDVEEEMVRPVIVYELFTACCSHCVSIAAVGPWSWWPEREFFPFFLSPHSLRL